MNDLPNPLTPADCDLTGYRWMPLDVVRVIDSDTFGISTGDEFKTAFRLWAKCWQQVPAASLPDDDRVLAHLAGLSENLSKWKRVRAVALRGFVKCSDGRLYHPVIAEKAIEAMQRRDDHAEREENQQTRQQQHRERRKAMFERLRQHGIVPAYDTKTAELERLIATLPVTESVAPVTENVTGVTSQSVSGDAPATAIDKDRTRTETVNPSVRTDVGGEPRVAVRPSDLSAAMRRHSIEAHPGDPRVIAAAEAGMTVATIEAACVEAKTSDPTGRIKAGFVIAIAQRWAAEANRPRNGARPMQSRQTPEERRRAISKANGDAWLAETPESDPNVIDMEH
ncbi:DUF1376 domain-containing protein [Burkholderia sp. BCC1644]|uniref:DUF1376 domain-containing protein n=1 Tax=Burkholderia sp. BCC1644 TaxID=2676293 RepID=UPI0015925B11|nr:DUF1376 domain-containing protein [Burkholderia sp. BCC1644]